jgi:flagellin-like hook-associated protein FlgL
MAVTAVNLGRVSQNMQTNLIIKGTQKSLVNLLKEQERLSTGLNIVRPSDNPIEATAVLRMQETLAQQEQYLSNIDHASKVMNMADTTLQSINDLLNYVQTNIGLKQVQDGIATADEREASAVLVNSSIGQMVNLGNTQYLGSYIFAGRNNTVPPYEVEKDRVKFTGDDESLKVLVGPEIQEDISLPARDVFGSGNGLIVGYQDLNPSADTSTRLQDLSGTLNQGIRLGSFLVTGSLVGNYRIDLSGCSTVGDVITKMNAALPPSVQVSLSADGTHLELESANAGETLVVSEAGQGTAAHDLGLYQETPIATRVVGGDLNRELTLNTNITSLNQGTGIDVSSGITITNGNTTISINFASAQTIQDVINTINASGMGVRARLNDNGTGIDLINEIAGSRLTIGENGGTTADDLGIRTLRAETLLTSLNEGRGINTVTGDDFKITASNGTSFTVDVDGASDFQDIIDKINASATAAGVTVSASLASTGNGITLTDNTAGADTFRVEKENLSNAASDLGILKEDETDSNVINGTDVNPTIDESIFTYLLDLRDGLRENDGQKIQLALERMEDYRTRLAKFQGKLGYMEVALERRTTQTENAKLYTEQLVSTIKDLDYTEGITKFQNLQTTLQANLQAGGKILGMSLLDFLR